jgi:hypothetical protein
LGKQAVNAVLDAGVAALIAKRHRSCKVQTKSIIELLEQQHTTVTHDVATIKCGLDNLPSNAPKLNGLIGTLWLRRPSVFTGFSYLCKRASARGRRTATDEISGLVLEGKNG